jgi:hypothetical protein
MLLPLCTALVLALLPQDRVDLKDGKSIAGRVVAELKDSVVVRVNKHDREVARAEVASVMSLERSLAALLERDTSTLDAAGWAALAAECESAGLAIEARNYWLRTLLADSAHAAARKALDAKSVKDDVTLHFGKHGMHLSALRSGSLKWKEAYELPTTHFVLKTDLPLPKALEVASALERFHVRFYALLGEPLGLYVFDERTLPEIRVYNEGAAFPTPPVKGERVWFSMGENALNVAADGQLSLPAVVGELSRQMLFSALRRGAGPTAQVQPWLSAGLQDYFARTAPETLGGPRPDTAAALSAAARQLGGKDVKLTTLFNAPMAAFSTDANRADMSTAACTLLHFLVAGRDGSLRDGFGRYVNDGAKGKVSMASFSEHLKLKPEEIEAQWREHVALLAR